MLDFFCLYIEPILFKTSFKLLRHKTLSKPFQTQYKPISEALGIGFELVLQWSLKGINWTPVR